jgi:cysteine desulfurase
VVDELIYLDYAATAPVDSRVAHYMAEVLALGLGNAAANHAAGRRAAEIIDKARCQVAKLIGAQPENIVFTSGATEANNLAISGTARAALTRGLKPHVVTLLTEHKSVLEPVRQLARCGVASSLLKPDGDGVLDVPTLAAALRPETCLVSLLHVNNETGVAQDIPALAQLCREHNVPLHVDACQSAGKLPLSIENITLLSFTAHKFGGPQGIGALYVAPTHRGAIEAQQWGGGHERGLRAGTLATHQIAGFGLACEIALANLDAEGRRQTALRERLWQQLADLPGVLLNGHPQQRSPAILNLSFPGVEGESLFVALPDLCIATGSACNSRSGEPSYVLRALGRDTQTAQSSLRFSLGKATHEGDVDRAAAMLRAVHERLWAVSPQRPAPVDDWRSQGEPFAVAEAGEIRLGTWLRFLLRLSGAVGDGAVVREVRVQVYGCPHTVAAANHVAGQLIGRSFGDLSPGKPQDWLVAVTAPVEKLGRMIIIEDALKNPLQCL